MTSSNAKQFACSGVALAIIVIASAPAPAQSRPSAGETAGEINAANKLLREGKVDEALEAFRHVVPGDQVTVHGPDRMQGADSPLRLASTASQSHR